MKAEQTKALQTRLSHYGHDVAIDGRYGPQTHAALLAAIGGPASGAPGVAAAGPAPDDDPETATLIKELERDEGIVLHAYRDSLGFWTIGIGRLIDERRGGGISLEEAHYLKRNDVARVTRELDARLPWWRGLEPVRRRALQNMCFQMGIDGLCEFEPTLAHIRGGRWTQAAANLRKSLWARQTPSRAKRVIAMIETGAPVTAS